MLDKIFVNGKIYTMDRTYSLAQAVGIKRNRIVKVGSNEDVLSLKNEDTIIVDLEERAMVPGFNDSHMHLLNYGYSLVQADLISTRSIDEVNERLESFISINNIADGEWVLGRGWNQDYFQDEKIFPTRYDLDKVSMEHPIMATRTCGHVAVLNSKAMEVLGIHDNAPEIEGGKFDLDHKGKPSGIARENALNMVKERIPSPKVEDIKNMIKSAVEALNLQGITSVGTDDFGALPGIDYEDVIEAYNQLVKDKELNIRVYEQCLFFDSEKLKEFFNKGYRTGYGDMKFKIGPLKLLLDGSLGARTAALNEPYSDDPENSGVITQSQDDLDNLVQLADSNQSQVAIHGIGDKAMYMIIEALEKVIVDENKYRHGIVHAQITDDYILDKLKDLDLLAYIQPIFLDYDWKMVKDRIGKERQKTSYNWKRMVDSGVTIACGSDSPVETFNVLKGIYEAVTRKDLEGRPKDGWLMDQALRIDEALYGYTMAGAYASFEEEIKGSIEEGKLADMVVLSKDIKKVEPSDIKDIKVDMTIFDGNIVN